MKFCRIGVHALLKTCQRVVGVSQTLLGAVSGAVSGELRGALSQVLSAALSRSLCCVAGLIRLAALWLGAGLLASAVQAQVPGFVVTEYTSEEGLPSNLVKDAIFDAQGFLWVATDGGLVRHDGVESALVRDASGAPVLHTKALHLKRDGQILLAADSGVWAVAHQKGRSTATRLPVSARLSYPKMVFEDTRGRVWVGDQTRIIVSDHGQDTEFEVPPAAVSTHSVRSFQAVDLADGSVLFASSTGALLRWFAGARELVELKGENQTLTDGLTGLSAFPDGSVWASHKDGVARLTLQMGSYHVDRVWPAPLVSSVVKMPWGVLLGGVRGLWALKDGAAEPISLGFDQIKGVQRVRLGPLGQMAVATDTGVLVFFPQPFEPVSSHVQGGIQTVAPFRDGMVALVGADNYLSASVNWYRTPGDGGWTVQRLSPLIESAHTLVAHEDMVWVLGGAGLLHAYDDRGVLREKIQLKVSGRGSGVGLASCGSMLWAAVERRGIGSLLSIDKARRVRTWAKAEGVEAPPRFVRCLGGELFAAFDSDSTPLMRLNGERFEVVAEALAPQVMGHQFNDVQRLPSGEFLIATNQGLWKVSPKGRERLEIFGGAGASDVVRAIALSQEAWGIWVGTSRGVANLSEAGVLNFQRGEGISNPTVGLRSVALDEWGQVWVSHFRGLARLSPHYRLQSMPPPYLTPLSDLTEPLHYKDTLLMAARAPFYPAASVQYQYRVDGGPWVNHGPFDPISVRGLTQGNHQIEVRSGGRGLAWSSPVAVSFQVAPPWWRTPWILIALATTAALLLSLSVMALRSRRGVRMAQIQLLKNAEAIESQHRKISDLLRNMRQGIFSINNDLLVEPEYSAACVDLLQRDPAGQPAEVLLSPTDSKAQAAWREGLRDVLDERDPRRQALYRSLLPQEIQLADRVLSPDYIALNEGLMIALTDITPQKRLQERIEREARRVELIGAAVADADDFFGSIEEFRAFMAGGAPLWAVADLAVLYRKVHTFKGTFNQLGFFELPKVLHAVEERLRHPADDVAARQAIDAVFDGAGLDALARDLEAVNAALGSEFVMRKGVVTLDAEQADAVVGLVQSHLQSDAVARSPVLQSLAHIRHLSLLKELQGLEREVQRLARRLGKQVLPLQVGGVHAWLQPEVYRPLLNNIGHVIRNAVDHGIELPQRRFEMGKAEAGRITILTQRVVAAFQAGEAGDQRRASEGDRLRIDIADDGAGIAVDALRDAARAAGWGERADTAELLELVLADGVSSKDAVTEHSGRGVGMGSLAQEVEALGGHLSLSTTEGAGTILSITIPWPQDPAAA